MNNTTTHDPVEVAENIVKYCVSKGKKFAFLSRNGAAGKTELSKLIAQAAGRYGHANLLDLDDFVVNTKLRNSASVTWHDVEKGEQTGRYTTSFEASYFLQNVKAILCNIKFGNNYYHWPKKAKSSDECQLIYGDALLTVVDGVGTVYLDRDSDNSVSIFLQCSSDLEIARRVGRGRFSNEQNEDEVRRKFSERNSQYKSLIEPHMMEFGLVLESLEDFSLRVIKDDYDLPLT